MLVKYLHNQDVSGGYHTEGDENVKRNHHCYR